MNILAPIIDPHAAHTGRCYVAGCAAPVPAPLATCLLHSLVVPRWLVRQAEVVLTPGEAVDSEAAGEIGRAAFREIESFAAAARAESLFAIGPTP